MITPTARTLAECRKRGYEAQVVEKWLPHIKRRKDLFGVIDIVAIVPKPPPVLTIDTDEGRVALGQPGFIAGIQACAGASHADRRAKILAEPRAKQWLEAGGRLFLWSWAKRGKGKQKLWTLRAEEIVITDFEAVKEAA